MFVTHETSYTLIVPATSNIRSAADGPHGTSRSFWSTYLWKMGGLNWVLVLVFIEMNALWL